MEAQVDRDICKHGTGQLWPTLLSACCISVLGTLATSPQSQLSVSRTLNGEQTGSAGSKASRYTRTDLFDTPAAQKTTEYYQAPANSPSTRWHTEMPPSKVQTTSKAACNYFQTPVSGPEQSSIHQCDLAATPLADQQERHAAHRLLNFLAMSPPPLCNAEQQAPHTGAQGQYQAFQAQLLLAHNKQTHQPNRPLQSSHSCCLQADVQKDRTSRSTTSFSHIPS